MYSYADIHNTVLSPGPSGPMCYTRGRTDSTCHPFSSVPNVRMLLLVFCLFSISPVAILYQSLGSFTSGAAPWSRLGRAAAVAAAVNRRPTYRSRYLPTPTNRSIDSSYAISYRMSIVTV